LFADNVLRVCEIFILKASEAFKKRKKAFFQKLQKTEWRSVLLWQK